MEGCYELGEDGEAHGNIRPVWTLLCAEWAYLSATEPRHAAFAG